MRRMEEVSLNETETRYYSDLFICCDVEKTGKIAMLKAMELYRSANVPNEVILEITSLAGIPATALHISRVQFYSCLKLIAAYQASLPLRQELIAATMQLALPRFNWKESTSGNETNHIAPNGLTPLPPPPPADRRNSLQRRGLDWTDGPSGNSRRNSTQQHQSENSIISDLPSTDSEIEQNESSCGDLGGHFDVDGAGAGRISSGREKHRREGGSPEAWSTNSDSPTPTNSVAERPWAKEAIWHGLLGDEHRQLLGTEEESSDRHSSEEDNESDLETIYQITPEQREYYYKQFKAVQHDTNGLLSGQVARVFFEKSRIPVEELRHIWQLCDVTRDGALSLAEFTAAMHLVVLRRNNIPLPAVLPDCLHPNVLQQASQVPHEPPEADLLHLNDDDDDDNDATDNTIFGANNTIVASSSTTNNRLANEKNVMNISTISASSQASNSSHQGINTSGLTPPPLPPPVKNRSISSSPNVDLKLTPPQNSLTSISNATVGSGATTESNKEKNLYIFKDVPPTQWTKFTESPTSNVSSPGPKPVNFDMQRTAQAVVSDPQILHPVALRVTPIALPVVAASTAGITNADNQFGDGYEANVLRDTSPKQSPQAITNIATIVTTTAASTTSTITTTTNPQNHRDSLQNIDLRAIQRPQAKKIPVKNIGAIPPPPQREASIGGSSTNAINVSNTGATGAGDADSPQAQHNTILNNKKEAPPLPPPRPHRHGRSSSLDLNKFKISTSSGQQHEITAQASFDLQTSTGFADFSHFPDGSSSNVNDNDEQQQRSLPPPKMLPAPTHPPPPLGMPPTRLSLQSNQRVSAFEIYRKPNTPRNSQSPPQPSNQQSTVVVQSNNAQPATDMHHPPQPTQPPPPAPTPFGAIGATAIGNATTVPTTGIVTAAVTSAAATGALPNADFYEKRVNAISETLRHVSFKQEQNNMPEILRHLREQNSLLLRLCNDLSDELLTVQTRKEEMRLKLETANAELSIMPTTLAAPSLVRTGSSISAPVTANITGGSGSSGGGYSNI